MSKFIPHGVLKESAQGWASRPSCSARATWKRGWIPVRATYTSSVFAIIRNLHNIVKHYTILNIVLLCKGIQYYYLKWHQPGVDACEGHLDGPKLSHSRYSRAHLSFALYLSLELALLSTNTFTAYFLRQFSLHRHISRSPRVTVLINLSTK